MRIRVTCLTRLVVALIAGAMVSSQVIAQEAAVAEATVTLTVTADRADAMYSVGDAATFTIEARRGEEAVDDGEVA